MKKVLLITVSMLLLTAGMAVAASNVEITGDYQFRYDSLEGTVHDHFNPVSAAGVPGYDVKNNSLMTNRFGLNLKATAVEDVRVKARLVMYKVYGHQTATPFLGNFFADRVQTMDGTSGHVAQDGVVRVDYAYATVSNVFDMPLWVSVGRRPSTGGVPGNIRQNREKVGSSGIPNILVDYAFDGGTIGYAPDIDALPGAYAKLCVGRGYETGFTGASSDTNFVGLNIVPYDEDNLHIEVQYQLGKNIFDVPSDGTIDPFTGNPTTVLADLGDIEWIGGVVTKKMGNWNAFVSAAVSSTDPTDNTWQNMGQAGMLWSPVAGKQSHTGNAFYVGARYDMGNTKVGAEYNQGSQYWIGMVPAGDDVWTSKLGTRGSVYEVYLIQELGRKAVAKKGKAYVKVGYQYYDFEYTGSNNWVGVPYKIDDLATTDGGTGKEQMLAPVQDASDLYLTFNVEF